MKKLHTYKLFEGNKIQSKSYYLYDDIMTLLEDSVDTSLLQIEECGSNLVIPNPKKVYFEPGPEVQGLDFGPLSELIEEGYYPSIIISIKPKLKSQFFHSGDQPPYSVAFDQIEEEKKKLNNFMIVLDILQRVIKLSDDIKIFRNVSYANDIVIAFT